MSLLEAFIIGIVQGICEFFPISSSAHIHLICDFFQIPHDHFFDLICHGGTACACLLYLFPKVRLLLTEEKKEIFYYLIAIFPLIPIYFLGKPILEKLSTGMFTGFFLLLSALFLFSMAFFSKKESSERKISDMLLIGIAQGAALIPGLSRSALTISTASLRQWNLQNAMTFSFLLSIPTIFGGCLLEILQKPIVVSYPLSIYFIAFITSFVMGSWAIRFLFAIQIKKTFAYFGLYCLLLAFFLLYRSYL
ncbi:MAG: undecaprenyl-diphosphate phosphatase [Parachlamydiales bacterium]|nr:undecaprenyl-diphosphate phosphatase [Parachlamydiales bacterium]